jgi:hypothetical protein
MVGKAWFVFDCSFVLLCGGGSLFAFVPLGTLGSVLEPYYFFINRRNSPPDASLTFYWLQGWHALETAFENENALSLNKTKEKEERMKNWNPSEQEGEEKMIGWFSSSPSILEVSLALRHVGVKDSLALRHTKRQHSINKGARRNEKRNLEDASKLAFGYHNICHKTSLVGEGKIRTACSVECCCSKPSDHGGRLAPASASCEDHTRSKDEDGWIRSGSSFTVEYF